MQIKLIIILAALLLPLASAMAGSVKLQATLTPQNASAVDLASHPQASVSATIDSAAATLSYTLTFGGLTPRWGHFLCPSSSRFAVNGMSAAGAIFDEGGFGRPSAPAKQPGSAFLPDPSQLPRIASSPLSDILKLSPSQLQSFMAGRCQAKLVIDKRPLVSAGGKRAPFATMQGLLVRQ